MNVQPVVLEGPRVRLEPLSVSHFEDICRIGLTEEIWRWYPEVPELTPAGMRRMIDDSLAEQRAGTQVPFVTVDKASGKIVGGTRFMAISRKDRRLEIGWTWIHPDWQRTFVNTEAKYLMLKHAFEVLGCLRVEFKTDSLNDKSRRALARIGAREEGVFRNHLVTSSGRIRHSVWFSIIDTEWPQVEARLAPQVQIPCEKK